MKKRIAKKMLESENNYSLSQQLKAYKKILGIQAFQNLMISLRRIQKNTLFPLKAMRLKSFKVKNNIKMQRGGKIKYMDALKTTSKKDTRPKIKRFILYDEVSNFNWEQYLDSGSSMDPKYGTSF